MKKPLVGILAASDSDLPILKAAVDILELFGVAYEITVISAHTAPERLLDYSSTAVKRGLKVLIAGDGGAAHLPGMCAAFTTLPVVGVPLESKSLQGLDSLLSVSQMPPGVPVATVAINGAKNAGILAAQILGSHDDKIRRRLEEYKKLMQEEVAAKAERLKETGFQKYLNGTGPL